MSSLLNNGAEYDIHHGDIIYGGNIYGDILYGNNLWRHYQWSGDKIYGIIIYGDNIYGDIHGDNMEAWMTKLQNMCPPNTGKNKEAT